ncbi:transglutaminase domain-containing protein [Paenibacillus harenae]|uniref:Transglutaminase-like domain-containing protein n=1 Tax=Paenibacillus harenae TaxID=306543 RepID=A0ABT9U6C7_PAEHA|nr:transglutaminase domain-containing protein [Paenibacillus harenae]MDQ0115191.1 hypothetical protein [Paenibacillus harenae]
MRKAASKLLMLVVIIAAAYSLELKLDLFPPSSEPGEPAMAAERDELGELGAQLADRFQSRAEHFSVTFEGDKQELSDRLPDIVREALKQDDYVAYILDSYVYTIRSWGGRSTISMEARYRESVEETAVVDAAVTRALHDIIAPDMNDHEKTKAIHDWIVTHVEYDQSLKHYTAYNAITLGNAVCQGYSLLGYKMLREAGIPVLIADGSVDSGEHAWNMVQLDGKWYHLDLTWDDPIISGEAGDESKDHAIRYNYYLKTDEELRADHRWTKTYPAAVSSYLEALQQTAQSGSQPESGKADKLKIELGLHWLDEENTVTSAEQLRTVIHSAVRSRSGSLQFRYVDGDTFPEALKAAFEGIKTAVGYKASYESYRNDGSKLVNLKLEYE